MIKDTHNKKKRAYGAFVGLVFSALLIFGLFVAIPAKTAQAENNYISNQKFYSDGDDYLRFEFFVNTSFDATYTFSSPRCYTGFGLTNAGQIENHTYGDYGYWSPIPSEYVDTINRVWVCPDTIINYTAGNTYQVYLGMGDAPQPANFCHIARLGYTSAMWYPPDCNSSTDIPDKTTTFNHNLWSDTELYNFLEFPGLTITYPQENYEIADAFYIQGNYTIPDASNFDKLTAYIGRGIPYYQYSFTQELTEKTGLINLRISGVLVGDYYIEFVFSGGGDSPYTANFLIENISILASIPPELPGTQEIPPDIFSTLSAQAIYLTYSNYSTSTALFGAFSGAIEPLITVIGDNLTFFSSQFSQDTAKDTGEKAGNAVLLIRSYAGNINSFFNDLPISEILFLYLSALVAVVVFRLIRLLIKLIPFI